MSTVRTSLSLIRRERRCLRSAARSMLRIALLVCAYAGTLSLAAEREEICAKYQKQDGWWSKDYAVEGTVISGSDLNSKVGSLTRFKNFSTYVVIFWADDQATILELPAMAF